MEKLRTDTHEFSVYTLNGVYLAQFQPINVKTGKPWQAYHRIRDGADAQLPGYSGMTAFSTAEAAWAAVKRKKEQLANRR